MKNCFYCKIAIATIKRPKNGMSVCKECFFNVFENEIHETIVDNKLFNYGERVCIGASGGKDSTVLIHLLNLLNEKHNYGLKLLLLSIDEGISGYRDDSIDTVKQNERYYGLPLRIISYKELYGWTMDEIVKKIGSRNNCTVCGVFRRQALDRGAQILLANKIVTGHNADDICESILMNVFRGDISRLVRCPDIVTGESINASEISCSCNDALQEEDYSVSRSKPFKYTYQKEIVLYARFKKLAYFTTECTYSPNSFRAHVRSYLKDLERMDPSCILRIISSGEFISYNFRNQISHSNSTSLIKCSRCHYISSNSVCKACKLIEGFNTDQPLLGILKSSKFNKIKNVLP